MSLPKVTWRFLGPQLPIAANVSGAIAKAKQILITSSSYWRLVESALTGTNSIIITPVTASLSGTMFVVLAGNMSGATVYRTPDDNTNNTTRLHLGICADSGAFTAPNSATPFGATPRWSRYWHIAGTNGLSASFMLESEESIFFGFKNSSQQISGGLAGVILESYDSGSGERNNRVLGMITTGPNAVPLDFWTTLTWMTHVDGAGNSHAGVFTVSGAIGNHDTNGGTDWTLMQRPPYLFSPFSTDYLTWTAAPAGASVVGLPLQFYGHASSLTAARALGRSRGFYASNDMRAMTALMTGSLSGAFAIGSITTSANDTVLFGPMSGSGIT